LAQVASDRVEVDFDHHSPEFTARHHEILKDLREKSPLAWTDNYGGFWIATGYAEVQQIATDDKSFSSDRNVLPEANGGILIPPVREPGSTPSLPVESDPPLTSDIRRALMPYFSPGAAKEREPLMHAIIDECLNPVMSAGQIDLVSQFVGPAPLRFTFDLMGLARPSWRAKPGGGGYETRDEMNEVLATLPAAVAERRQNPRDDMITLATRSTFLGEPATDDLIVGILTSLVIGGSDTSTALMANSFGWLDQHPDQRRRLVDHPELIPGAIEEFLRYFPPNLLLGRTVIEDVEVGGHLLRRGERVLMAWAAANRDPSQFEDPEGIDFERGNNRHATFGIGLHRCLGLHHARMEARLMLAAVLERMPDYVIDWPNVERYEDLSASDGYVSMPATFAPNV
jgi:cytochrome P450